MRDLALKGKGPCYNINNLATNKSGMEEEKQDMEDVTATYQEHSPNYCCSLLACSVVVQSSRED